MYSMVRGDLGGWKGANVSRWGGPSRASGRTEHGSRFTLRQGQGGPFERLRSGLSRGSGRTEHGSPRFTLRQAQARPFDFPQGERNTVPPGSPFGRLRPGPSISLRANGTRLPPVHPSAGSGRALREPQDERNTVPPVHPSAGSGQALREAQGERNTVPSGSPFDFPQGERIPGPPGSPFGRLRAGPSISLRANGSQGPPAHPSAGSGQALREAQGERNTVAPGSPFGRLRAGPSRGSGRTEHGCPRLTLRQAQGRPFERLRANGSQVPPVLPSMSLRANGELMWRRRDGLCARG